MSTHQNTTGNSTQTQIDIKQLWENVLVDIELSISKANFSTWFKDTCITHYDEDGIVHLGVPNQFVKDWLSHKYHKFILKALRNKHAGIRGVEYVITKHKTKKPQKEEKKGGHQQAAELPLGQFYVNKTDNLNPRYTFDTFVIGPFNELAYAAAQAILKKPGITYNPLFVYGKTGLGKTHLIQAIGNHLKKVSENKRVYYLTSERFTVDYSNAVQEGKANSFKEKYRQYDVLIMDDIQFLSKKEKTQEELFHLFNALYENNKQIIFSSDQHPNYIPDMEERLKSRFSAGMIVDIAEPEHESRAAILRTKAQHNNILLDDEVVEYLATTVQGSIRELEGVINTIICQSQIRGRTLTKEEVEGAIKDTTKPQRTSSVKDIIKKIADFYEIQEESVYEKTRRKEVVRPRQMIMYVLREDYGVSYPTIGQKLGGRDHTTVIHSYEKIHEELKQNNELIQELQQIRMMLK